MSLPTPLSLLSPGVLDPLTNSKPATAMTFASLSNYKAIKKNTTSSTSAPLAVALAMDQLPAFYKRKCAPLHPFNMCQLRYFLRDTFLASRYPTLLHSFETGFLVGIPPIKFTFAPANSATIQSLYSYFVDIINKEFSLQ